MAVIHHTTLTPGKLELLSAWLPSQPWYRDAGRPPELDRAGGFRLDDPHGEVGIEFMVVTDAATGTTYHVPLTYRADALPGADDGLITTAEHGVLGRRWVYDGAYDPVLVAQLVALIQGAAEPQAQRESNTPDPTVTTGPPAVAAAPGTESAVVASTAVGTELQLAGGLTVWINRILRAGEEHRGPGVFATWKLPDGTVSRGVFATARHAGELT
jgi:Maltokinase N-terminal cap domain